MSEEKKTVGQKLAGLSGPLLTLWQLVKFIGVGGLGGIIQAVLQYIFPVFFDGLTATLPKWLDFLYNEPTLFDTDTAAGAADAAKYIIGGTVTWGYVLPFFLANIIANIFVYIMNKKYTFKSSAPRWHLFAGKTPPAHPVRDRPDHRILHRPETAAPAGPRTGGGSTGKGRRPCRGEGVNRPYKREQPPSFKDGCFYVFVVLLPGADLVDCPHDEAGEDEGDQDAGDHTGGFVHANDSENDGTERRAAKAQKQVLPGRHVNFHDFFGQPAGQHTNDDRS